MPWELTGNNIGANAWLGSRNAQPLRIRTSNTEKMTITPDGNVGIGNPAPGRPLQIGGAVIGIGFDPADVSPNAGYIRFGDNTGWKLHFGREQEGVGRPPNTGTAGVLMTIQDNGNVGIGTTDPGSKLTVVNEGGNRPQAQIALIRQTSSTGVNTDSNALLRFEHSNGQNSRVWMIGTGSNSLFGHPDSFGIFDPNSAQPGPALVITPSGNVEVSGDIILRGADCAEDFDVAGIEEIEPGTVMVIDEEGGVKPSQQAYDKRVAGVISGAGEYRSGIILDKRDGQAHRMSVALMGKVYCKVDAHYSPIEVGDLLTTSPTPGHAMKADDPLKASGAVIGKALRPLKGGQRIIPILAALQ